MNWAGPAYDDVGLALTDRLWQEGFYADLIPSTEIGDPALCINEDGLLQYGPQTYAAAVLYHPEFENLDTAAFFQQAAKGRTALYRVGPWTRDFEAQPFDFEVALPASMVSAPDAAACAERVLAKLRALGVTPHTPATAKTDWNAGLATASPEQRGVIRLIDGTRIMLSGEKEAEGDPIVAEFDIDGRPVRIDAIGMAAARLDAEGRIEAFAAGGLKRIEAPGLTIELPERIDVAFWHEDGRPRGVIQGATNSVPSALAELTENWQYLRPPTRQP
jgi:hypothetical protein